MTDPQTSQAGNADQIEYWNTGPGAKWVGYQDVLDRTFHAVQVRLLERAAVQAGERILDIGCGAGATTMDLAALTGPGGRVIGVDIAAPMLDRAQARATKAGHTHAEFLQVDAQTHGFDSGAFDLVASRFGVMFFSDPVTAFANITSALRPGGRVHFVSWANLERNPWFALPRDIAVERLGETAPVPPNAPGPMAFQDTAHVSSILAKAGLTGITADVEELQLSVPGSLPDVAALASNLGPIARVMKEKEGTAEDLAAITEDLREKFAVYATSDGFQIPATLIFYGAVKA